MSPAISLDRVKKREQSRRVCLNADNTRFLLLAEKFEVRHLGSCVGAKMLRCLSADREQTWGIRWNWQGLSSI